jgi:hypothetical protein
LRLEHNTVERKTNQNIYITSDEKIKKGDCFIENGKYIFNGSSSPVSDTFIPRRNQNHQQPKLNQRECKPLMMSF